jgi:cell division protein FtsL
MNRLLSLIVAVLVVADVFTLSALQRLRSQPAPPDLTARVTQLEKDLSQAQQEIGELKQEMALVQRRGQPAE